MVDDMDMECTVPDQEKAPQPRAIDNIRVLGLSDEDADFYNNTTVEQRKTIIRKVDRRLVPLLAVMYLISHLDRANIGNAKIEGLVEDLDLVGNQYNIVLGLFFVPYILFKIPSNILLKKFTRPSVYLGSLVTTSGVIMALHGIVKGFGGLLANRILLGIFKAGFYLSAVYLCSSWAANNLAPLSRRAIDVAFNICVGNIGGIIGSYMYLDKEAPRYQTGFGLSLAFGASGMIVALLLELSYKWGNKRKAKLTEDEIRWRWYPKKRCSPFRNLHH
ncbi:hypothetical protein N0V84_012250 [Fusarium piperis]|uniref:Major facilitator superfamily (MFS) profile domain-containing protein n=1 Tax=Fusarium piperis TaxID=1435070 RepID=A0A9W8W3W0_9HYPO|nr:hypothetical protein N0V84_012250 [Fusarium piperis]